ncbi:YdaS family helix-turn-helix protein [Pseudomonas arsenicoxydans]|uniref:Transcriptional regulator n=1 Tax=Pseudomonas arsenicoxydans TaxID=702115 RepID=A0A502HNU7_9PSED|nr:YdaS family helix-turn-helix protein [Pseudomonas arsenicoxydans]TPG76331.1 hypothetical protein EAH78_18385 [Pseudomonas arsenicoxydans]
MTPPTTVQLAAQRLINFFENSQTKTGQALGVSQSVVSQWSTGVCGVSAGNAFKAEAVTKGAVKAWELCLDIPPPNPVQLAIPGTHSHAN